MIWDFGLRIDCRRAQSAWRIAKKHRAWGIGSEVGDWKSEDKGRVLHLESRQKRGECELKYVI